MSIKKKPGLVMCLWHSMALHGSGGGGVSAKLYYRRIFLSIEKHGLKHLSIEVLARSRHALMLVCVSALAAETFTPGLLSSCLTSRCGISSTMYV